MEDNDSELVSAYYEGNHKAFEELYHRHKGKVFNFALRIVGERAGAEDVVSEAFLALFRKRFTDNGSARLSTWLFTVSRNAAISKLRSRKNVVSMWFQQKDDHGFEEWEPADSRPGALEALNVKEESLKLRTALNKLPLEQKEALVLREYFAKDYREISQILGCSLEKVKILIFRARENLRVELADFIKEAL